MPLTLMVHLGGLPDSSNDTSHNDLLPKVRPAIEISKIFPIVKFN